MWEYTGRKRPPFAHEPAPGQECVWDYPRPPKLIADQRRIVVRLGDQIIADSAETFRILETAGPPTFYIPPRDVRVEQLQPFLGASICEWKSTCEILESQGLCAAARSGGLELSDGADSVQLDPSLSFVLSRSH